MLNLPDICMLNRRAIELMRLRIFHLAEDLLDHGIYLLEAKYCDSTKSKDCNQGPFSTHHNVCSSAVRMASVSIVPGFSSFVVGSKQDSSFAMYDKAFDILPVPATSSSGLSRSDASLSLCVFYYNLGLCYRMSSLPSTTKVVSGRELEHSLLAYEMAYDYLQESSPDADLPQRVLELALLNNLGHMCTSPGHRRSTTPSRAGESSLGWIPTLSQG